MQTNRILLAFVAVAALVAMVAFPSTSGVIAQTYDTQKRIETSVTTDGKDPQDISLMQWVSIEGTASTIDDEEEDDARESAAETLVSQNDSEGQSEGENEYTTSFRAENCTFSSTGRNPFFILETNYQLALSEKMAAMLLN